VSDENKIRITPEEVRSQRVDDALSQQGSFGMPAAAPIPEKTAWYYKSWFVLLIAGSLGAFAAWLLIEPFYGETVTITGKVEEVSRNSNIGIKGHKIAGELRINGETILLLERSTQMDLGSGWERVDVGRIGRNDALEVEGGIIPVEEEGFGSRRTYKVMHARRIRKVPADAPATTDSLDSLHTRMQVFGFLFFPITAAFVGLFIGAADGLVSRAFSRAFVGAFVGLGVSFLGAVVLSFPCHWLYSMIARMAIEMNTSGLPDKPSAGAFILLMSGRGAAWALIGASMGMGPGVALKSKKLFWNGVIGGCVGGLLGGLLFDPINYVSGGRSFSETADSSRAVGLVVIGVAVGVMIGLVELIAREAWIKMLAGPLAGKEFVIYKDPTTIGSSPKREIYLFKDPEVEPVHAKILRSGEGYEIEDQKTPAGTFVNGRRVQRQRLKNKDQIRIGQTVLLFTMKEE
jgi:hypothetical protein